MNNKKQHTRSGITKNNGNGQSKTRKQMEKESRKVNRSK